MHYYQFNIGDYASHTRHLTNLEDLAYRRLLDAYYLQERPLNAGVTAVARQINMRDHEAEVKAVLEEFWVLSEAGWINRRADFEIQHYQAKRQQASNAGKASAERRLNASSTDVQPTNNQEPRTKNKEPKKDPLSANADFERFWKTWPSSKRKVAKPACLKFWNTHGLNLLSDRIIEHVAAMKKTEQWKEGFEPAPLTYLNQNRWEDGLPVAPNSSAMPEWAVKRG
jgi:uncharacterized protein YdaU (DUF1376 family)